MTVTTVWPVVTGMAVHTLSEQDVTVTTVTDGTISVEGISGNPVQVTQSPSVNDSVLASTVDRVVGTAVADDLMSSVEKVTMVVR